jgi:hypothetical protein
VKRLAQLLAILARPHARWVVIVMAMAMSFTALVSPLVIDDPIHQIKLRSDRTMPGFDDPDHGLFVFFSGEPVQRAALMEEGLASWWTAEDVQLGFWRPLSSVTHRLDHAVFGTNSVLIHAHSLLWFFLLLCALSRLYARFHGPSVAVLALAIYAFDDARGFVLSLACNRNALIAVCFGVLALVVHDRWRRDGWRPGALLGPALFGVSLLAGEMGLSTLGFLFAYALFLDRGVWQRRLARLFPYALVVVMWQFAYSQSGAGVMSSGVYVHPLADPLRFVANVLERLPILAMGQFAGPPSDIWLLILGLPMAFCVVVYGLAMAILLGMVVLVRPLLKAHPVVCFWGLGTLLACVPISATFANDRLLVFVGVGASGLLACLFAHAAASPPSRWRLRAVRALVVIHLVVAPFLLPVRSMSMVVGGAMVDAIDQSVPADVSITDQSLVVVSAPADGTVLYMLPSRAARAAPRPDTMRVLATGDGAAQVTRLDAHTLRIRPVHGYYATEGEQMLRDPSLPFAVGDIVTLSNMVVTVTEVNGEGRAMAAEFRFVAPLEDPRWRWTRWDLGRLVPWVPPAVGERAELPSFL